MLTENTPENIKRLRQKIGLTQKECAEIFSMTPRTWRRKEEPVGTVSGTALTPVEFKYLQLLAGEHPEYVLCKRDKRDCSPPCRARLPTSQAATVCVTDLRWPPWAETTSPAVCNSSMPLRSMLIAALISRSCSTPHSGHCHMRLFNGISGIL